MAPPAPRGVRFLLYALVFASSAFAQDARTVVPLDTAERDDFDALASLRPQAQPMPPRIAQKLPPAFRKLAMSTHQQIDLLASDAARRDARLSLEQISRLLQSCNSCHAAYRF